MTLSIFLLRKMRMQKNKFHNLRKFFRPESAAFRGGLFALIRRELPVPRIF